MAELEARWLEARGLEARKLEARLAKQEAGERKLEACALHEGSMRSLYALSSRRSWKLEWQRAE
jgi:hypothetical protein